MIYDYREVFSLRDEIGTCPNIEIDIDVTDKTLFFIRPYHVREEDKRILDREMEKTMLFRNIERSFFSIFKPSDINQ